MFITFKTGPGSEILINPMEIIAFRPALPDEMQSPVRTVLFCVGMHRFGVMETVAEVQLMIEHADDRV